MQAHLVMASIQALWEVCNGDIFLIKGSLGVIFQKDPLEAELWSILLAYLSFKLK